MSTTLRKIRLKIIKSTGVKYFKAVSNFNVPYIICSGDYYSENPFFRPEICSEEIISCAAWCFDKNRPVIFDIGAHCGYHSTHFAALLKHNNPQIYSFEPVTQTYFDLVMTIKKLKLQNNVFPIHAALSNIDGVLTLNSSKWLSMMAQVISDDKKESISIENKNIAIATTIDKLSDSLSIFPDMIKLDVEGYESFVLQGADQVIQADNKPAICIEWNPATLAQCGSSVSALASQLKGYDIYYINDYEFGKKKFLEKINDVTAIPWVCNLFALPPGAPIFEQWKNNIEKIQRLYHISIP